MIMKKLVEHKYLLPFAFVASLFFFWGFAHSILDVLNKHFQDVLVISKTRSALVQTMVYGGYFCMAIPAGMIIRRWGYQVGVVVGLLLYGIGALLFIPGERLMSFEFFLLCLFIIGCGLTCLETAANPYVAVMGEAETSASRLNLAQSLNGLGWIVGPLVGGLSVFGNGGDEGGSVALPYGIIGCLVLFVAVVFLCIQLPELKDEKVDVPDCSDNLWKSPLFSFGLVALFFYVAAQTGINSFFINYSTETAEHLSARDASMILSFGGMGLFFLGRLIGSWLMNRIAAARVLWVCGIGASVCMVLVIFSSGLCSHAALVLTYLFEAIMFPTIFALSLQGLDASATKRGSSYLIMSIIGGAVAPVFMGYLGENNISIAFIVPLICFSIVTLFAAKAMKTSLSKNV